MEDEEADDQDGLVEELSPTLHQESHSNLASTMQTILLGRDSSRASCIFHSSGGSHGIFTTNADTIEEKSPAIAYHPTIKSDAPRSSKHKQTKEHNDSILNKTPSATNAVTQVTNQNLADDDTENFEIGDGVDPLLVTDGILLPACWPYGLEEWGDISNGEEDITWTR
jgi:hypothetical protein